MCDYVYVCVRASVYMNGIFFVFVRVRVRVCVYDLTTVCV